MFQEYWVVGGTYRDSEFHTLHEGSSEVYGPFRSYDDAFRQWTARTERTRAEATTRFSVVVTAPRR